MSHHPAPTDQRQSDALRITFHGAAAGASTVIFAPITAFFTLSLLTTLALPDSERFRNAFDLHRQLNEFFTWPWHWIIPLSAVAGAALAHALVALGNVLDRRRDAEHARITTCEACNGPKIMEGNPAIWVCADPTCIMRERAWWER